jgi:hypothetical protein
MRINVQYLVVGLAVARGLFSPRSHDRPSTRMSWNVQIEMKLNEAMSSVMDI